MVYLNLGITLGLEFLDHFSTTSNNLPNHTTRHLQLCPTRISQWQLHSLPIILTKHRHQTPGKINLVPRPLVCDNPRCSMWYILIDIDFACSPCLQITNLFSALSNDSSNVLYWNIFLFSQDCGCGHSCGCGCGCSCSHVCRRIGSCLLLRLLLLLLLHWCIRRQGHGNTHGNSWRKSGSIVLDVEFLGRLWIAIPLGIVVTIHVGSI
mmetsp:Transcript_4064/g.7796  ORF Transcript_4064/g.7796 Transcript_4064/m.7796 type:complete len:208 (+) Transcript_4064:943-1566(+)